MRIAPRAFLHAAHVALAASIVTLAAPAAAQDPPPPLPSGDAPPPLPPADAPPPLPPFTPPPATLAPPVTVPATPPPAETPSEPGARPGRDDARVLTGQTLLTPALLDSAFVATYLGVGGELGHVADDTSSFNTVTGHLQLGVAFLGRVEVGVEASYAGFVVGDQETAVQLGGQNAYDVRPGLRLRAFRSASTGTQIGLHAYGVFDSTTRLNPAGVLAEIGNEIGQIAADPMRLMCLESGNLSCALLTKSGAPFNTYAAMKVSSSLFGGGASVSLAQAFGSRFALQASVGAEVGHGDLNSLAQGDVTSTPVTFYVGVAPSLTFGPDVPIALMAEYRFDFVNATFSGGSTASDVAVGGTNTTLQHGFAGGVYYTGRPALQLGVVFKGSFASSTSDGVALSSTTTTAGLVTMRYFF